MKNLQERKSKIPYDKIDKGYRRVIQLFNKFPFLITTSCCQGHATSFGGETCLGWHANAYITFEVEDEERFLALMEEIVPAFYEETEMVIDICKEYHFRIEGDDSYYHWRLSYSWSRDNKNAKQEVEKKMLQGRKCLERLIQKYQKRNRDERRH